MAFLGAVHENHQLCLEKLLAADSEIIKHFPDLTVETIGATTTCEDIMTAICAAAVSLNSFWVPLTRTGNMEHDLADFIFMGVKVFAHRQVYGLAFGFSVFGMIREIEFIKKEQIETALALRNKVQADIEKYSDEMKIFEPLLLKIYKTLDKTAFYYLDMMMDDKHFAYLCHNNVDSDNRIDIHFIYLRKRWDCQWLPNGKTPFFYKLLHLALLYLNDRRLKQARHVIAVTAELMKTVDQNTAMYKKLQEMFFMVETVYLSIVLSLSELHDVMQKSPALAAKVDAFALKDKVIDFGIPLPDGEDPNLPVALVVNEAGRKLIYKKLPNHGEHLKQSSLPYIPEIYQNIVRCNINWFNVNNGKPFHGGKH